MKNPIRAWVAKIVREEMQADLIRRNQEAIRDELKQAEAWGRHVREAARNRRMTEEAKRKAGWIE